MLQNDPMYQCMTHLILQDNAGAALCCVATLLQHSVSTRPTPWATEACLSYPRARRTTAVHCYRRCTRRALWGRYGRPDRNWRCRRSDWFSGLPVYRWQQRVSLQAGCLIFHRTVGLFPRAFLEQMLPEEAPSRHIVLYTGSRYNECFLGLNFDLGK